MECCIMTGNNKFIWDVEFQMDYRILAMRPNPFILQERKIKNIHAIILSPSIYEEHAGKK